mgnify:CR=1 FL=1
MINRARRWLLPVLGIAFILMVLAYLVSGKNGIGGALVSPITEKNLVQCQVTVVNKVLQQPKIESYFCEKKSACLFMIAPFGIIPSDNVRVQSVASDGVKSQSAVFWSPTRL